MMKPDVSQHCIWAVLGHGNIESEIVARIVQKICYILILYYLYD